MYIIRIPLNICTMKISSKIHSREQNITNLFMIFFHIRTRARKRRHSANYNRVSFKIYNSPSRHFRTRIFVSKYPEELGIKMTSGDFNTSYTYARIVTHTHIRSCD